MSNSNSKDGSEAQQNTTADDTSISQTIAKPMLTAGTAN